MLISASASLRLRFIFTFFFKVLALQKKKRLCQQLYAGRASVDLAGFSASGNSEGNDPAYLATDSAERIQSGVDLRSGILLMEGEAVTFDEETTEFLDALKLSTRSIYSAGLEAFQSFYAQQGTIKDFLDRIEQDQQLPRRERKRVARTTLKGFVDWMTTQTSFKPKTIRTYMGAVQSLARYLEIDLSTRYIGLPPPNPATKKYPWTLESVGKFATLMDKPLYKCLVAVFFQSGLGISDVLALTYEDVKAEYEMGTVPLCLDLVRIKTATPHITFLGKLGIGLLRDYLETRGLLDSADRLFPISKTAVERFFVRRAQNLSEGYEGRVRCGPHTLRTAFRTLMVDAGCPETYAEFFMGHNLTSDIKKVYTSKTRDGWRTEYAKYEKAVTFSLDGGKQNMPQSAKTLGYDSASEYPFSLIKLDKKENVKGNLL